MSGVGHDKNDRCVAPSDISLSVKRKKGSVVGTAYTKKQGQYLAFIYYYMKMNDRPPAEADIQRYFEVSPPSVHQMIVTLEKRGFISHTPGQARSIQLRLSREELPYLE